nr:N-acetylmuramoyl-L-alanine amidase [uncultured Brumimicrobium sp.]
MKTLLKLIGLALLVFTFSFTDVNKKTIVIDVAHGGEDHGCVHESHIEKEIVASIANKIIDLNQNPNTNIVLTREADKFISLDERAKMINNLNPEFVISLHANYHYDQDRNGTEIYICESNAEAQKSKELANHISHSFNGDRIKVRNANFQLLKNVEYPIAFIELGFLSNAEDRTQLISEKGQTEFAYSILRAIERGVR